MSAVFIAVGTDPCVAVQTAVDEVSRHLPYPWSEVSETDFSDGVSLCEKEGVVCLLSAMWTQFWALGTISWNGMIRWAMHCEGIEGSQEYM